MSVEDGILDFPTAWAIQGEAQLEHDPRCSSVPGWHPLSGPGFLCDCGAVEREYERQRGAERTISDGQSQRLVNAQPPQPDDDGIGAET